MPTGFDTLASDNPINSQSQDDTDWIQPGNTWPGSELYRISSADMLQNVYIGVSRSFPCERACSNDDHALKRVFLYLHVFSEIWFSKFFKILEVKKGISQEQRKLLGNFLSFVCSFNIFFFLFFFRRTPSSILCIYSYKKENIPEQGKKFFPLKMKIRVYISNEPAYSLNKKYLERLSFELYD